MIEARGRCRPPLAAATALGITLLLAACGAAVDRPTKAEAERAYARMLHERQVAAETGWLNLPPRLSALVRIDTADCKGDGDGELHCPALIADEEDNAERDTHKVVVVFEQTETGWRVKMVE